MAVTQEMSDVTLTVLDGSELHAVDLSLPEFTVSFTGERILELAHSRASASLYDIPLPNTLKDSALRRICHTDPHDFLRMEFVREDASQMLRNFLTAFTDEIKADPIVIAILDGSTLRLYLDDEVAFAMLAENLFAELHTEDKGKISKSKIPNAIFGLGVETGVPPCSEFPKLNDILKKHLAEEDEELGQSQFKQVLQTILLELADTLAEKHVVVIQNIRIINGSKLRKLLANEEKMSSLVEAIIQEKSEAEQLGSVEVIRSYLEKNAGGLGLPPSEADVAVVLLYDDVFAAIEDRVDSELQKDATMELMKEILEKFAEHLDSSPVYHYLDCPSGTI